MTKHTVDIEKHGPSKKGGTTYVLRDARSGRFVTVDSTGDSATVIKETASRNRELLDRLAKR